MIHARRVHTFQKVLRRRRVVCSTAQQQLSIVHSAAPHQARRCAGVIYQHQLIAGLSGTSCTPRMRRVHCRRPACHNRALPIIAAAVMHEGGCCKRAGADVASADVYRRTWLARRERRGAPVTMDSVCAEPNLWMCSMASSMESTSSSVSANVPYSCLGLGAAGSPSARVLFSPPYMVMSAGAQEQQ